MLEYDEIDVSEAMDTNKTGGLSECIICHYLFFLTINFRFQRNVYNGYHDLDTNLWTSVMLQLLQMENITIGFFFVEWKKVRTRDYE